VRSLLKEHNVSAANQINEMRCKRCRQKGAIHLQSTGKLLISLSEETESVNSYTPDGPESVMHGQYHATFTVTFMATASWPVSFPIPIRVEG